MNFVNVLIIIIILTCIIFNYLNYRQKEDSYLKASKKWDGIVKELSKRK